MQRRAFLGVVGAGTTSLAGCIGGLFGDDDSNDGPDGEPVVTLRDNQFDPRNLSVERGATVRWTNEDAVEHTVTAASGNWTVDYAIPAGEPREYTFEADGVYTAYCRYHGAPDLSGMAMKIGVGDSEIDEPLPDDDYPY